MRLKGFCWFLGMAFLLMATENYRIEIRNAPSADVIRMLYAITGKNILISNEIGGSIEASFPSISLQDGIKAILDANNLEVLESSSATRILPKKTLEESGKDLILRNYSLKYARAKEVGAQLNAILSSRGSFSIDERTNSITVRDRLSSHQHFIHYLEQVDKQDKQILIEAKIIEASDNLSTDFGIQWGLSASLPGFRTRGLDKLGQSEFGVNFNQNNTPAGSVAGIAFGIGPALDLQLEAAEQKGKLNILSKPSIVTSNNRPATIHSGTKFYIKTGSLTLSGTSAQNGSTTPIAAPSNTGTGSISGGAVSTQEINSGITLVVTPQVTTDNKVILTINVTESQADFGQMVDGIPAIIDNNASTTVLLDDKQTTVIGGLFQKHQSSQVEGIPFLARIPIIGALFGGLSDQNKKKELMIFLTPTIIEDNRTIKLDHKEE